MTKAIPDERITILEIKEHPWFLGRVSGKEQLKNDMKLRTETIINLKNNDLLKKYK